MEAKPLELTKRHLPFDGSLLPHILECYTNDISDEQPHLSVQALLASLATAKDNTLSPLEMLSSEAEAAQDPLPPSSSQRSLLTWLDAAFHHWQEHYPVEQPLSQELHKLLPLCAALAVCDPDFLIPGVHPLHRAMDALHNRAVGWQAQLGRAGDQFLQQMQQVAGKSHDWLQSKAAGQDNAIDLKQLSAEVIATCIRDQNRFARMMKRVVETKRGRLKATGAKLLAGQTLNALADSYGAPGPICEFLLGPWYDSMQLVLLKFGQQSNEWKQVETISRELLESVQPASGKGSEIQHQQLMDNATRIPKLLRKWLLSLQHDPEQVAEAMQLVEFSHLRVMKHQPLELEQLDRIHLDVSDDLRHAADGDRDDYAIDQMHTGQWFEIITGDGQTIRAELALNLINEQQLLFVNQAGIKALEHSYGQFTQLLAAGKVRPLPLGASFSKSLAWAVGIVYEEDLSCLGDPAALTVLREARAAKEAEALREIEAAPEPHPETETDTSTEFEVIPAQPENTPSAPPQDSDQGDIPEFEVLELDPSTAGDSTSKPTAEATTVPGGEEAEEFSIEVEPAQPAEQNQAISIELTAIEDAPSNLAAASTPSVPATPPETAGHELLIPMGTWLGFHDGEFPMMAKLAVHDRQNENFIFVDREGIRLRDMTRNQLLDLIDRDLVDILQTRVSFKDAINDARNSDHAK